MIRSTSEPHVKSAVRALGVLQLFNRMRRPATAKEIGAAMGLPPSSASMLLRTLVALGYLSFHRKSRTFLPTLRVVTLGQWMVDRDIGGTGALVALMNDLSRTTGQLVAIALRKGIYSQYVHVIPPAKPAGYDVPNGAVYPLSRSTAGWALLAPCRDEEISRIVLRSNVELDIEPVEPTWMLEQMYRVRQAGYAYSFGQVRPGSGAVSITLPNPAEGLVLAIGGNGNRFVSNVDEYLQLMREGIAKYLGKEMPGCRRVAPPATNTTNDWAQLIMTARDKKADRRNRGRL